jgi:hypothetical protein
LREAFPLPCPYRPQRLSRRRHATYAPTRLGSSAVIRDEERGDSRYYLGLRLADVPPGRPACELTLESLQYRVRIRQPLSFDDRHGWER